jgi:signal transduction histidine kinase/PAS domain-containing protein/ActR/RegA family two-component response regulator
MAKSKRTPVATRSERDAFLVTLGDRLRDLIDPRAIMAVTCEQLGKHLGTNRALYAEMEDDVHFVVHDDYCRGVPTSAGTHRLDAVGSGLVEEALAGHDVVVVDTKTDPRLTQEQAHYDAIQMRASIAAPLVKGGRLKAILAVHQTEPRQWSSDEVALVRDVAERTWAAVERAGAETALRANEQRLRLALEASGMGLFQWNAKDDRIEADAQILKLFDVAPDAEPSLAAAMRARIHPEDRARYDEIRARALDPAGIGAFRAELRLVHSNGDVRWIVVASQSCFEGVPPRAVGSVGTVADITERKRAEVVLATAARRDAFRVALSDALRPLAAPNEVRRAACRVLRRHLGANRTFYAEVDAGDTHFVVDEDETEGVPSLAGRHRVDDFGPRVLGLGREGRVVIVNDVASDQRLDQDARAAYGSLLVGAYIAAPLIKEGRLAAGLVVNQSSPRAWKEEEIALVEETADRTWAAVERTRAEQELREADRRKDEFLAILAHELRNPLAPLRNALEVMKLAAHDSRMVEQARDMMTRQLVQMVRLIDDLLDVSRISRGKVDLRRERFDLGQIIKQAVEMNRPLIEASSQHLTIDVPAKPIFVEADPTRLAQVFANLLNNAAKYTERAGEITLSVEPEGEWAVIRVRDTGIGIPPEMLPRVFDMFLQVDRSLEKAQGGLGVGLSLVKGLVELHDGSVEAHSEGIGRGSEFVVRLPMAPAAQVHPARRARKELVPASARRRILVVDDNRDAAISMATLFGALSYETRTAFDGLEAIQIATDFRPAIVLLDIGMPRLNGYETCRRMRQQPWGRNMVMVALTGWGRDEDQQRSKAAGFDFHLVKPVDPTKLSHLLTSWQSSAPP